MKVGVSQSPAQSDTGQIITCLGLVTFTTMESAFSLGLWTRSLGTLVARTKVGFGSVKKRQGGGAVAGSRRLWWGGAGRAAFLAAFRPVLRRGGRCPCCAGRDLVSCPLLCKTGVMV